MIPFDAQRFSALATALDTPPRHLLVAAARLARGDAMADPAHRAQAVADARGALGAAEGVAALLLTPIASFAMDELDRALANLWPARSDLGS